MNKTVEIWNKRVHFYSGNYEKYLQQKAGAQATQLEAAYKNQQDKIEQLEAFINRFRAQATKAKQVQSRIKELEKIERIEIPPDETNHPLLLSAAQPSGRKVVEAKDLAKRYGEKQVFSEVNFTIERGDRIALVGVNGAGKSTLIKLLDRRRTAHRGRAEASATTSSRITLPRTSTRNSIPTRACSTTCPRLLAALQADRVAQPARVFPLL